VLQPTDWEGVELALSSTNAAEHLSLRSEAVASMAANRGVRHRVDNRLRVCGLLRDFIEKTSGA
jgi:hypothetical protein